MRTLKISLLLFLLSITISAQEGWFWQNPLPQGNDLFAITFPDINNGFAVGDAGMILRTSDGGNSWHVQESGTTLTFFDVFFIDSNIGWAVGGTKYTNESSIIAHTTNGGATWMSQSIFTSPALLSVHFLDSNNGFVVNANSTILQTTDGGTNWTVSYNGSSPLADIFFINANVGWAVGGDGWYTGKVVKTTDSGNNWVEQNPVNAPLDAVYFMNANKGWAVGSLSGNGGIVSKTSNGGENWISYPLGGPGVLTNINLSDIYFINENVGLLVVEGTIFRSTDGGVTWTSVLEQWRQGRFVKGICFVNTLTGWAVGNEGIMYKTNDGGITWLLESAGHIRHNLKGVSFSDNQNGWVVGGAYAQLWDEPKIMHTTNGGETWISQTPPPTGDMIYYDVYFVNVVNGWAVGHPMTPGSTDAAIIATTDGGNNWSVQVQGSYGSLFAVCFTDQNNGWVVGGAGIILSTTNGGNNWIQQSSGIQNWLLDVSFADMYNGTVVGSEAIILHTTNGGITWNSQISNTAEQLNGVHFINIDNGYAVGNNGTILKTSNAGLDWSLLSSGTTAQLKRVYFRDIKNGWIVGEEGIILSTSDGGTRWLLQVSHTAKSLSDVFFINELTGWVVGDNGTILHTTNGGVTFIETYNGRNSIPAGYHLSQNYPNPFNPITKIKFEIPGQARNDNAIVTLKIYDILGREVATLVNEEKPAGEYEVEFKGTNLPSGIYFYQLKAGQFVETRKMVLLK